MSDQARIMSLAKDTKRRGTLMQADFSERMANPSCGDVVTVHVQLRGDVLENIRFEHQGCTLSSAGSAFTADYFCGKTVDEMAKCTPAEFFACIDLTVGPMRENCVLLGLRALQRGIHIWMDSK